MSAVWAYMGDSTININNSACVSLQNEAKASTATTTVTNDSIFANYHLTVHKVLFTMANCCHKSTTDSGSGCTFWLP